MVVIYALVDGSLAGHHVRKSITHDIMLEGVSACPTEGVFRVKKNRDLQQFTAYLQKVSISDVIVHAYSKCNKNTHHAICCHV